MIQNSSKQDVNLVIDDENGVEIKLPTRNDSTVNNKKIKVLQITHDLAIGGLQRVVVTLCKSIDLSKFEVSVLCLRALGEYTPELVSRGISVKLIPQPRQGKTDYLSFLKVAQVLKDEKPDIIHTHNTQPLIDGTMASLLTGIGDIIHTDHARCFPDKKKYMFAEWAMSHFVKRIVGVSLHTSKNLIHYEKIKKDKIVTIPNGIESFPTDIDKKLKRAELGIAQDTPVIGCCVRLTEQKGISTLLEIMPEIITAISNVTLVIAGDGPLEKELKRKAAYLNIEKNVMFLGPRLDIPDILATFDLYIMPSIWEGLPMILLEAIASGCPVVAFDVGGVSTVVKETFNGRLIEAENSKEMRDAIISALRSPAQLQVWSENAKEYFSSNFEAKKMTSMYENLYIE